MQPYLFPYIGYFQLISAVDRMVIHDDVKWIKGGWINRNRILISDEPQYITLPVLRQSSELNINQRLFTADSSKQKKKQLRRIENAYRKAPYFKQVFPVLENIFACGERNVAEFVIGALKECCIYLKLDTPLVISSNIEKNNDLCAEDRVLDICSRLHASCYINLMGGVSLYDRTHFLEKGIRLKFIKSRDMEYKQFNNSFVPCLSIIDVMMFNNEHSITRMLDEYDLV
jgi:hypothetical protein